MTTQHHEAPTSPDSRGIVPRLIAFASTLYLIFIVTYLALRVVLNDDWWWVAFLNAFAVYTFLPAFVLGALTTLAGLWRATARLGIVAIIAVIWFGQFFQPKSVGISGAPTIKVVTLNVLGGSANDAKITAWLEETDADFVLLQELTDDFAETLFSEVSDRYPHQYHEAREDWWLTGLLSKHEILEASDLDNSKRRQRFVVNVDGVEIALYNVHLSMPVRPEPRFINTPSSWLNLALRYDEAARNAQIDTLLAALKEEPLPYIVGGDFNLSQHSIKYSSLAVVMTDSFRETETGLGPTYPASASIIPPLIRIDYIWHNRDSFQAIATEIGPDLGSDHLPVTATIEIRVDS